MSSNSASFPPLEDALSEPEQSRLQKKLKESPSVVVGVAAGTGVAAYGLYNIRNSKIRVSYYLMQLRVAAQGSIIALLVGGTVAELYGRLKKKYVNSTSEENKQDS